MIFYNDPTLYNNPKLTLGWCIGKNDEWYLPVISDIIRILASKNNIKPKNILFYGSSAGGFTSIMLSTLIKNSASIVNNPQIFILKYVESQVNHMLNACFDNLELEKVLTYYKYRFDAVELFKHEKYVPYITYLVNMDSRLDTIQLIPFINYT